VGELGPLLLGYIDESYVRGDRYWLGVALVPAGNVPDLVVDLRQMMAILPEEFGPLGGAEVHGHALFHGTKAFAPLRSMTDLRIRLYRRGLEALAKATTDIIFVGVDWSHVDVSDGLALHRMHAVTHLLPLVERRVAQRREHCLLIADEEETTRHDFVRAVREHKRTCLEGPGECRVVDSVLFVDSQDSPGVQCADLATFLHARVSAGRDTNPRAIAANRELYRVLEGCRILEEIHDGP
jgi:Protein of unknown function (DUF3800)